MPRTWGGDDPKDFGVPHDAPRHRPRKQTQPPKQSAIQKWLNEGREPPKHPYRPKDKRDKTKRGLFGRKKKK